MNFITGNLWSITLETNYTFPTGVVNYTVYVNDTIGKEVNVSSNFTIKQGFNITIGDCGDLDVANSYYTQVRDISQNEDWDCINITAQNITFDGNGFSITSDYNVSGIVTNQYNTTIKNSNISMGIGIGGIGIEILENAQDSKVFNNSIYDVYYGFNSSADMLKFYDNNIYVDCQGCYPSLIHYSRNLSIYNNQHFGRSRTAFYCISLNNSQIYNNNFTSIYGAGLAIYYSYNNNLTDNYCQSNSSTGLYPYSSYSNIVNRGVYKTNSTYGIYLRDSENNEFYSIDSQGLNSGNYGF